MVGSSNEEEMELVLLPNFDLIYQDFKNAITEIELLKTNSNAELKIREALQFTSHSLRQENERLTRLQSESLYTLADQRTKCQSLKELNRVSDERLHQEYEHKKSMDLLKRDYMTKVGVGGSKTGFEEYMNLILDDAREVNIKKSKKYLGFRNIDLDTWEFDNEGFLSG